ncbi:MAG: hypothetical protein Q4D33_12325, partial [Prevotellaceae bacterium]|nr:hypothetical protein [Prevotellaceae bacterium]
MTSIGGWAQTDSLKNSFKLSLDFMTHGELCGGGLPKSADPDIPVEDRSCFILGRTRLIMDYERPYLTAHAVLQNRKVWGTGGNETLTLYEGWAKLTAPSGLFVQVGRVAMAYDDERIIGTNDFSTASLSHDVLRFGYEGPVHKVHGILAYNQNEDNVYANTYYDVSKGAQFYKSMQTVWYHLDVPKFPLGASLLFMNMGLQAGENGSTDNPPSTVYQQMYGGYLNYHPKRLTLEGAYYRQTGKMIDKSLHALKIRAWMASFKATVDITNRYGAVTGYDHLSGDDYMPVVHPGQWGLVRHDVTRGFSPMYGSRTKFYGIMDYYYQSAYLNGFTPGLQNAFIGGYGKPVEKLTCNLTYHYLAVSTKLEDYNRTLGHSIDFHATYDFTKDISLSAGYTYMFGTETMKSLKQDESSAHAHWGWFSLFISPELFSAK